jgi:hypothetical protein
LFAYVAPSLAEASPPLTSTVSSQFGLAEKKERTGRKLRKERKSAFALYSALERTRKLTRVLSRLPQTAPRVRRPFFERLLLQS